METPYDLAQAPPGPPRPLPGAAAFIERWALPPLLWRIARFLAVGLVGLAVDAGLFAILYAHGSAAPTARAVSLICATAVTWALNRVVTFAPSGREPLHEALRYGLVALLAQGFNYVSFLTLLHVTGAAHPLRTLVATAVVTAGFSFTGQSLFAFRRGAMRSSDFKR